MCFFEYFRLKVTNTTKDTTLKWFKEGAVVTKYAYDQSSGVSKLTLSQVSEMIPIRGKKHIYKPV